MPFLPKIARSGRRRRRFSAFALKNASPFSEARQLVEATFPSNGFTAAVSFADVVNNKKIG